MKGKAAVTKLGCHLGLLTAPAVFQGEINLTQESGLLSALGSEVALRVLGGGRWLLSAEQGTCLCVKGMAQDPKLVDNKIKGRLLQHGRVAPSLGSSALGAWGASLQSQS